MGADHAVRVDYVAVHAVVAVFERVRGRLKVKMIDLLIRINN